MAVPRAAATHLSESGRRVGPGFLGLFITQTDAETFALTTNPASATHVWEDAGSDTLSIVPAGDALAPTRGVVAGSTYRLDAY